MCVPNATNNAVSRISQANNAIAKPYKTGGKSSEISALQMANNKAKEAGKTIEKRFAEIVCGHLFPRTHTYMHASIHVAYTNLSIIHLPRSDTEMPVYRKRDRKRERNKDRKGLRRNGEFLSAFSPLTFLHPELRVRMNMIPTPVCTRMNMFSLEVAVTNHSRSLVPQPFFNRYP